MSGKIVAITICERCGQTSQSEVGVHRGTDDQYDPTFRYAKPPSGWEREWVQVGERKLKVAALEVVADNEHLTEEGWLYASLDLCPTCRMSFAMWWMEGSKVLVPTPETVT